MTTTQFEIAVIIMISVLVLLPVLNKIIIWFEKKELSGKNYDAETDWLLTPDVPILDEHEVRISE